MLDVPLVFQQTLENTFSTPNPTYVCNFYNRYTKALENVKKFQQEQVII